jgi:hypothetical protein
MTRRTRVLLCLLTIATVALALPAGPASAAGTGVTKLVAKKAGSVISVTGSALFAGEKPNVVSTDTVGDGPPASTGGSPLGVDLVAAHIYTPNPKKPSVVFEWKVTSLPPTGSLPEINRYIWGIHVANGSKKADYVLQAKFTNIVSSNAPDDPAGHLTHIGNAFQLRGNCSVVAVLSVCEHLAWLDGAFDVENDVARIVVPLGQSFMPEAVPGAAITPFEFGGSVISACHSFVVSNAYTCDDGTWSAFTPYLIGSTVTLGAAKAGTPLSKIAFTTPAKVLATGAFSGALKTTGLHGPADVWARACLGGTCATRKVTITI